MCNDNKKCKGFHFKEPKGKGKKAKGKCMLYKKAESKNACAAKTTCCTSKASKSIVDLAVATPQLSTLVTALQAADLVGTLSGDGPFTVFAPTNDAFAALPKGVLTNLLKPENKQYLVDLLTYHVASGDVRSKDLSDGQQITTVNGEVAVVSISGGHVMIGARDAELDDAKVTAADIAASNGVVHVIDAVMTYTNFEEHWLEH
jgi:uncharacterized surface protein with fasciclin (FAS1) repeats